MNKKIWVVCEGTTVYAAFYSEEEALAYRAKKTQEDKEDWYVSDFWTVQRTFIR